MDFESLNKRLNAVSFHCLNVEKWAIFKIVNKYVLCCKIILQHNKDIVLSFFWWIDAFFTWNSKDCQGHSPYTQGKRVSSILYNFCSLKTIPTTMVGQLFFSCSWLNKYMFQIFLHGRNSIPRAQHIVVVIGQHFWRYVNLLLKCCLFDSVTCLMSKWSSWSAQVLVKQPSQSYEKILALFFLLVSWLLLTISLLVTCVSSHNLLNHHQ